MFAAEFKKPFKEQVDFFLAKLNIGLQDWLDLQAQYNDLAFWVTGVMQADLLADLRAAVDTAIAEGRTVQWFREQFDRIVAERGWGATNPRLNDPAYRDWRARIIYTTNVNVSFAAGRWAQLTDPEIIKVANTWVYRHSDLVSHPRPMHLAWNRLALPATDPWWQTHYPPKGYGCRCYVVAMTRESAQAAGYNFSRPEGEGRTYDYTDRKTGVVTTLPVGVDPGWNYAPGMTAAERARAIADGKRPEWPPEIARAFDALMRSRGAPA